MSPFPDDVAFCEYASYLAYVTSAAAGDGFTLWSIAEMRRQGRLLVDNKFQATSTSSDSLLSASDLAKVVNYLTESELNEIFAITSIGSERLEAFMASLDSSDWEPLLDAARRAAVSGGSICVLPFTQIDSPEFYLADAKRPNEMGEVPVKVFIE